MTELVGYLLLFIAVGFGFIFVHLMAGKLIRPAKPDAEKLTIYECGEPTIGSAWIQFDLRFYVVALLFVIFDVEVAFFFPWAVVFGHANTLAGDGDPNSALVRQAKIELLKRPNPERLPQPGNDGQIEAAKKKLDEPVTPEEKQAAQDLAWIAFWDILVFFGVLLVGFAYLWKRGDLDWVRSLAAEKAETAKENASGGTGRPVLVGAGRDAW